MKILFFTITLLVIIPLSIYAQQRQVIADAARDAKQDTSRTLWRGVGCGGSILGVGYAFVAPTKIPVDRFMGRPAAYVGAYTRAYKLSVKRHRVRHAMVGCGVSTSIGIIYGLVRLSQEN